jgi:hypothetical protein
MLTSPRILGALAILIISALFVGWLWEKVGDAFNNIERQNNEAAQRADEGALDYDACCDAGRVWSFGTGKWPAVGRGTDLLGARGSKVCQRHSKALWRQSLESPTAGGTARTLKKKGVMVLLERFEFSSTASKSPDIKLLYAHYRRLLYHSYVAGYGRADPMSTSEKAIKASAPPLGSMVSATMQLLAANRWSSFGLRCQTR